MGITKQLQDGEYTPTKPELAEIHAIGAYNGTSFTIEELKIDGKIFDVLGLLAVTTATVLCETDDPNDAKRFIVALTNAIEMIKQEQIENDIDEE